MNTERQIEELAKAYADSKGIDDAWMNRELYETATPVLRWLLKDHAVAEKDKVRNLYRALENDLPHIEKDDEWVVNEAMERMEKIFGKELVKEMEQ